MHPRLLRNQSIPLRSSPTTHQRVKLLRPRNLPRERMTSKPKTLQLPVKKPSQKNPLARPPKRKWLPLPPRSALFTRATRIARWSRSSRLLVSLALPLRATNSQLPIRPPMPLQLTSLSLRVKVREPYAFHSLIPWCCDSGLAHA